MTMSRAMRVVLAGYLPTAIYIIALWGSSFIPAEAFGKEPPFIAWDKVIHFLAFAALTPLIIRSIYLSGWRAGQRRWAAVTVAVALVVGVGQEWIQGFTPGREPSILDLLADVCGAITVILILYRLRKSADSDTISKPKMGRLKPIAIGEFVELHGEIAPTAENPTSPQQSEEGSQA